ncbi:MAG: hypothetical protein LIP01_14580, partial [Tannerellaceae bacterium]|nr:hypothetical protein [Tannerellaceae bacterium]
YSLDWLLLGQGDKLKQSYIIRVPTDADEGSVNESSFVYGAPENNKAEDIQRLEREVASLIESCHTLVKTNSQLVDMNIKLQSNPK